MPNRIPINPGRVDWSGENPGIYLKDAADAPWRTLALFFRVVLSPRGRGTAMLILGEPDVGKGMPEARNLCISDNQPLMRYLVDDYIARFPTFRGRPGLAAMAHLPLTAATTEGDPRTRYVERVSSGDLAAEMCWEQLGKPFAVEVNAAQSATGAHEMYSVFVEAKAAHVAVNGHKLGGKVFDRNLFGHTISTAFLAFSETWVIPKA